MRLTAKNKGANLIIIILGFALALSFSAFAYTAQAVTTIDTGSGLPIGERQVSQGASEPVAQKGIVKCGLRNDDPQTTDIVESDPCTFCSFFQLFNTMVNWVVLIIVPAIALLFVVLGGFLLATSRGSPGQSKKGNDMIIWTFAGIAVMFVGWMVLNSLLAGIGVQTWTHLRADTGEFELVDGTRTELTDLNRAPKRPQSPSKDSWKINEWQGIAITINHPGWPDGPIKRTVGSNEEHRITITEPLPKITGKISETTYNVGGGWWQFTCGTK